MITYAALKKKSVLSDSSINFGNLIPFSKTDFLEKNKTAIYYRIKKKNGMAPLGTRRETMQNKKNGDFFLRFWINDLRHS